MISLPHQPKIIEEKDNRAVFEVAACYPGYGITLGNSMRRALLSSLPGAAITGVKIKGIQHEFSTLPYVMEDMVQIILNLKQVCFKLNLDFDPEKVFKAELKAKGEKELKAGDIKTSPELTIVNPEAHLATLTDKKAELDMEIDIECNLGYSAVEQRKRGKVEIGYIAVDAMFSPVKKVNYQIENMRVGERTDYDRIIFTVETNRTITPREAFSKAAQILVDHYKALAGFEKPEKKKQVSRSPAKKKQTPVNKKKEQEDIQAQVAKTKIEDLKFSGRVTAILIESKIKTAAGLVRKSEDDLKQIEGLGAKGIKEIKRVLGRLGLTLRS